MLLYLHKNNECRNGIGQRRYHNTFIHGSSLLLCGDPSLPDTKYLSILLQHVQVKTRTVLLRPDIKLTGEKLSWTFLYRTGGVPCPSLRVTKRRHGRQQPAAARPLLHQLLQPQPHHLLPPCHPAPGRGRR